MRQNDIVPWFGSAVSGLAIAACLAAVSPANASSIRAQQPAAGEVQQLEAVVIEVHGSVKRAPVGVKASEKAGWTPVAVNDRLTSGTQIKVGMVRSDVVLRFGDDTVVQIRKMSLASIDDFYRDPEKQTVRLSLGYGAVRGGSVESELRSDLVVDSTVATLAKRGTEGLGMEVEPSTMYFEARLTRSGLLSLLSALSRNPRTIQPGEYANDDNVDMMPVEQKLFDLEVKFYSDESKSEGEASFASRNSTGNAVLSPASGSEAAFGSGQNDPDFVSGIIDRRDPALVTPPPPAFVIRPEGDFGVPNTFGALLGNLLPNKRLDTAGRTLDRSHIGKGRVPRRR